MAKREAVLIAWILVLTSGAVKSDDSFFPTYVDDNLEEQERAGIISLTSTSANYTINLTGVLLLGLALAAAVTLWAYLHTFLAKGGKGGYGEYSYGESSYKRSADDPLNVVPVFLSNMHRRFEEMDIEDLNCRQRIICEATQADKSSSQKGFAHEIKAFFGRVEKDSELKNVVESDKVGKVYFESWTSGNSGKTCKNLYPKCAIARSKINEILDS